jgi:hypothetical protein
VRPTRRAEQFDATRFAWSVIDRIAFLVSSLTLIVGIWLGSANLIVLGSAPMRNATSLLPSTSP